ncbi:MAG: hypothetical protein ACREPS_08980 [Rhodanobacteraceae bacterium]
MKQIDDRKLERQVMRAVNGVERYAQGLSWLAMVALVTLSALAPQAALAQVAGGSLNGLCTNATNAELTSDLVYGGSHKKAAYPVD